MCTFLIYCIGLCEGWIVWIEGEAAEAVEEYRTENVNVNGRWSGYAIWRRYM